VHINWKEIKVTLFVQYALIGPKWRQTHRTLPPKNWPQMQYLYLFNIKGCFYYVIHVLRCCSNFDFLLHVQSYPHDSQKTISQPRPYLYYLHSSDYKYLNHGLQYDFSKQSQVPCNTCIWVIFATFSPTTRRWMEFYPPQLDLMVDNDVPLWFKVG